MMKYLKAVVILAFLIFYSHLFVFSKTPLTAPDVMNSGHRSETIVDRYFDNWQALNNFPDKNLNINLSFDFFSGFNILTQYGVYGSQLLRIYADVIYSNIVLKEKLFGSPLLLDIGAAGYRMGMRISFNLFNTPLDPAGTGTITSDYASEQYFDDLIMGTLHWKKLIYFHFGVNFSQAYGINKDGTFSSFPLFSQTPKQSYTKGIFKLEIFKIDLMTIFTLDTLDHSKIGINIPDFMGSSRPKLFGSFYFSRLYLGANYYNYARYYPAQNFNAGISAGGNFTIVPEIAINFLKNHSPYNKDPFLLLGFEFYTPSYSDLQNGAILRSFYFDIHVNILKKTLGLQLFGGLSLFSDIRLVQIRDRQSIWGGMAGLKFNYTKHFELIFSYNNSYYQTLANFIEAVNVHYFKFSLNAYF